MPISEKMRQRRRKYLGSSDIPALMGVSPFQNAADVWISKTQDLIETPEKKGHGSPLAVGTYSEAGTHDWAMDQLKEGAVYEGAVTATRNQFRVKAGTVFAANCDAIVNVGGVPTAVLEVKSTARTSEWGRPLTDEIPESVLMQVQWQMLVTEMPEAWVAAMLVTVGPDGKIYGGLTYSLYRVKADPELQEMIEAAALSFWADHVETGIMPEDSTPRLDTAERIRRTPESVRDLKTPAEQNAFEDLSETYLLANAKKRDADKRARAAKSKLLAFLGETTSAFTDNYSVEYPERVRNEYVVSAATYRVLRVKARQSSGQETAQ